MRIALLITLVLGYYCGSSQAFSKTGTDDLYLYKGTVLYKDGNGFIVNVQKNFDTINVFRKYEELFLRVVREKESVKPASDLSGLRIKTVETITRHVCKYQIDTSSYGRVKNCTINDLALQGTSLAYFPDLKDSLQAGDVFYFNQYVIMMRHYLAEKYKVPILTVERNFNFCEEAMNEEREDEEDISVVETGDPNFPYEVKVPETFKNKGYHKTSTYLERPIADNYKTGNSQFFAIINEQTKDTSFILGSMHGTEAAFWNKKINQPELFQRLVSCRALYFESMNADLIIDDSTAAIPPSPQNKTVEDCLTVRQKPFFRRQYNTYLKKDAVAYEDLIKWTPRLIYGKFANTFFAEKDVILEIILAEALKTFLVKKGIIDFEFKGLDTKEEAIVGENFSINYYTPQGLINKLENIDTYIKSMWQNYENGDIEKSAKSIDNYYGPSFYDTLVAQRNNNWLPRMIKAMQGQRCFFVVGAAHLGGPQGILNLLREKGYSILPLKWLN